MKKIIFSVNGGIGKSLVATAVCKAIKKQYPNHELIVLTGYPEVFINNPDADRCYNSNALQYFYTDHVAGKDAIFMLQEPYLETDFINRKGHLAEVWCAMNNVAYNGEMPAVYLTHKERTETNSMIRASKPILLLHTNGGLPNQTDKYSWTRDLPARTAQKIVNAFAATHTVMQIRRQDQPALQNAHQATADFRQLAALIVVSEKRLFIDSFAQHTAAALGLPSVVVWIANIPGQFGYGLHNNIMAKPATIKTSLKNSVFSEYNIVGPASDFPYNNEEEIFDADELIAALSGYKYSEYKAHETAAAIQ